MKIHSSHTRLGFASNDIAFGSVKNTNNAVAFSSNVGAKFSSVPNKELNYNIGLLQSASLSISAILNDNSISLNDVESIIHNASFMGRNIFTRDRIVKSEDLVLFDANSVLDIIPTDDKDIYIFKKSLKDIQKSLLYSIDELKRKSYINEDVVKFDREYLLANDKLFSNAHNTDNLASKIDLLLT